MSTAIMKSEREAKVERVARAMLRSLGHGDINPELLDPYTWSGYLQQARAAIEELERRPVLIPVPGSKERP